MRKLAALAAIFMLIVSAVHAQNSVTPSKVQDHNDENLSTLNSIPSSEEIAALPLAEPTARAASLPEKPEPAAAEGQWIGTGEVWDIPDDLVIVAMKHEGHLLWHVQKVNSCESCGEPLTWKQAMFDKQASSVWAVHTALMIADIETTHRMPCFEAGTCREGNPLLGQSRAQAYAVSSVVSAGVWIGTAWLRKGSKKYRIGGYKSWWIVPVIGDALSVADIAVHAGNWHSQ